MMTDALHELVSRVAICELKARYFRAVDTKNWDSFETLFADDAVLSAPDDSPDLVFSGRAAIRTGVAASLDGVATVHFGPTPEIGFDGPDEAHGVWAMQDELFFDDAGASPIAYLHGYGHYHERYRKEDGQWRLVACQNTGIERLKRLTTRTA